MKKKIIYTIAGAYTIITIICLSAQINYNIAVRASIKSDGSDSAIEQVMLSYGFSVDALDPKEPSLTDKIKALFIKY